MVELSNQVHRVHRKLNLKVKQQLPLPMQLNLKLNLKTLDNHSLFRHQLLLSQNRKQLNQGQPLLSLQNLPSQHNLLSQLSQHNLKKLGQNKIWVHFNLGKMR